MANVKRSTLTKSQLVNQAVVNKLITPRHMQTSGENAYKARIPSQYELYPIVKDSMERIEDADKIFDILPDLQQVAEIAISGILSSKDLVTTVVNFDCPSDEMPIGLKADLLQVVKDYFENAHPLKTYLQEILYDVLFITGSYGVAIIPESSVDAIINDGGKVALEAFNTNGLKNALGLKGILGNPSASADELFVGIEAITMGIKPATEADMKITPVETMGSVYITDNADVLKLARFRQSHAKAKIASAYNSMVGLELRSENQTPTQTLVADGANRDQAPEVGMDYKDQDLYKDPVYGLKAVEQVKPHELVGRKTIGRPLVQHMPSESIIPVHIPGNLKHHVGYFIMLDETGNPISRHSLLNNNVAMQWLAGNPSSQIIQDVATNMGFANNQEKWTMQRLSDSYTDLVEAKLIGALKNGVYGEGVGMCRPQEAYQLMMARSLSKKATQILYIPAEQFCYFALDYNDWGVGRSLLDRNKMLSTVRSAFIFATMSGATLNATRNLQFQLTLDPDDREPEKTIEDTQHRIMQQFANRIPFEGTPNDIMAYIGNAGISWSIEGNEHYPSTKIVMADDTPDYKLPDNEVAENLAKQHYRGLMVDPDLILNPQSIEFASQITSKDLINTKRICKTQERLAPLMSHYVKTYIHSDGFLKEALAEKAKAYLKSDKNDVNDVEEINRYLTLFVEKLTASLPPPDTSMLNSQAQAFEDYNNALDKWLDAWVGPELLAGTELESDSDSVKTMVKNYLLRQWMRKNDIDKDLLNLLDAEDMQENIVNMVQDNVGLAKSLIKFKKRLTGRMETLAENEEVAAPADGGFGGEVDTTADGDTDFGNDLGGDDFGGDDLDGGMGNDQGGDLDAQDPIEGDDLDNPDDLESDPELQEPDTTGDLVDEHADAVESAVDDMNAVDLDEDKK